MTSTRIRAFIERHLHSIITLLVIAATALWVASTVVSSLQDWVLKNSIFQILILILLADVLLRLAHVQPTKSSTVQVFRDEPESSPDIRGYVEKNRPTRADLIEYSTATIHDLLESLKQSQCSLRILICHPESAFTDFQRHRILDRIRDLETLTFRAYPSVEIRMYRLPAAIRGRLIDGTYVTVGWHVYTSEAAGLHGHTYPMVTATSDSPEGRILCGLFNDAFDRLWSAPSTSVLLPKAPAESQELSGTPAPEVST